MPRTAISRRSHTRSLKTVSAVVGMAVAASVLVAPLAANATQGRTVGMGTVATVAPYSSATSLVPDAATLKARGADSVVLSFVTNNTQVKTFSPTWNGWQSLNNEATKQRVADLKAHGIARIVSFGGESGTDLAVTARDANQLATVYSQAVALTGASRADFDVEGYLLNDTAANIKRFAAIKILTANHPGLAVSFTLPVATSGLVEGKKFIAMAKDRGVRVDAVNIMAMCFGNQTGGIDPGAHYDAVIRASIDNTAKQLAAIFGVGLPAAYQKLGVTMMVGRNMHDHPEEVATPSVIRTVATYARANGMPSLSLWSVERDRPGTDGYQPSAANSGTLQPEGAHLKALAGR